MATKKDNKRHVVRRVRRALNLAETPIMVVGNILVRSGYGKGAGRNQVDARDDHDIYDYDWMFYFEDMTCDECDCYDCMYTVDAVAGTGWSFESANDDNNPKLGELIAA